MERRPEQVTIGIITIVATVLAMSFADAVVKYVSATFTLWQIYVLRSLIVIPALILISGVGSRSFRTGWRLGGWVGLRSLLLALMYVAIYAAVPVLSLSVIAASLYTAPLFIALLSALLIGEPVGLRRWAGIVIGFAGVLLILRPAADGFTALALIPVAAALLYAMAAIITRSKCIDEAPMTLALGLNLALLGVGTIATLALSLGRPMLPAASAYPFLLGAWGAMDPRNLAVLALLAALMLAISLGLAKAYQSAPPTIIATFDYCYLPFAAFWSYAIFSEPPDLATIGGMVLIAMAGLIVMPRPRTVQQKAEAPAR
ncbi:DMT family transporter [Hypericibacter sp.]|uniref:DMT family transporter n=1 Tax=Hypericibacter sp. TaxID=2705401 RepID=UPI003D6C7985